MLRGKISITRTKNAGGRKESCLDRERGALRLYMSVTFGRRLLLLEIHVLYFMKNHKQDYIHFSPVLSFDVKILITEIRENIYISLVNGY